MARGICVITLISYATFHIKKWIQQLRQPVASDDAVRLITIIY